MTPREVLIRAKALIDTPEKWGQSDADNPYSIPDDRYCAMGAVGHICRLGALYDRDTANFDAASAALEKTLPKDVNVTRVSRNASFNDQSTWEDVMAWFDRAIEAAGGS